MSQFDSTGHAAVQAESPITRIGLSLFVILTGSFIVPLLIHSSTLAIPAMAQELHLDAQTISWFTLVQVLSSACFVLPAGKLSDMYGRRRVLSVGLIIAGLACVISGFATSSLELIIGRCLQGIGGAFVFAAALTLVSSIPPADQKAKIMGLYVAIAYFGVVIGPLFGGFVIDKLNWRWVFHVPAIILLLIAWIGWFLLDWERYGDRNARLRFLDSALYMASLSLLAISVFRATTPTGQLLLLIGIVAFAAFFWFQTKRRDPLLQVTLFLHHPTFSILGLTHFLTYMAVLSLPLSLTLYLQYIKGLNATTAGLILIWQAFVTVIVAPTTGWMAKQFRVRYILIVGMGVTLIAMACFYDLDGDSSVYRVIIGLILVGLAAGIMDSQLVHVALTSVDDCLLGSASATLNALRTIGGFIGIGIVSYLMNNYLGEQEIVPELYPQLNLMLQQFFIIAIGIIFVAFVFLLYGLYRRSSTNV